LLTKRIIPCLDVKDGRVVKGVKFQGLRDAGSPVELAKAYEEQGADELVLLDVSATPEGRNTALKTVEMVRSVLSIPLTVGGGIRTAQDAQNLLEAGADKVGINTAAVKDPELIGVIARRFGRQCTVLAVDAKRVGAKKWQVVVLSGKNDTGLDVIDWIKSACERGAGEILLTCWDRDGTREGYDLELIQAAAAAVNVPIIASGGVDNPQHLLEGVKVGADAVLATSIFHYGEYSVGEVKRFLKSEGVEVRL